MAAALWNLNNYLDTVLGINDADVRVALNTQGLTSFNDFISMTEKDITNVCAVARKPGGMIPNPAFVRGRNAIAGVPALIPNPGVLIGHLHEKRLKMLRFYLLHLRRIQRDFDEATATVDIITAIYEMKEQEDEEEEVELPDKLTSVDKVRRVLENVDDYLIRKKGASGLPLAYVVRESLALPAIDPGFGQPSYHEEMIQRGPHTGIHYETDNHTVWDMIRHVTHEGPGWNWVQPFQRTRDGRAAYLAIKTHYLGESFTARTKAMAEHVLEKTFYDGKVRSFTFERYCEVLQGAFTDMSTTNEPVAEARKVRILLSGIEDTRLSQAKSQVLATPSLKATFDSAVNFLAQFLDEKKSYTPKTVRTVSSTTTTKTSANPGRSGGRSSFGRGGRGRGRGGRGGRSNNTSTTPKSTSSMTDRYYTPQEWAEMTAEQQQKVGELRSERDKRRGLQMVTSKNSKPKTEEYNQQSTNTGSVSQNHTSSQSTIATVTSHRSF